MAINRDSWEKLHTFSALFVLRKIAFSICLVQGLVISRKERCSKIVALRMSRDGAASWQGA